MSTAIAHTWPPALQALTAGLARGAGGAQWRVQGLKGGARAYFLWRLLGGAPRPALVIAPTGKEAERLAGDLRFCFGESDEAEPFARRIHYLPGWEVTPFEDLSPASDVVAARIEGLYHLRQSVNPIVITTPEALLQRVPARAAFANQYLYVVEGEEIDRDDVAARLVSWGYRRVPLVEDRGDVSIRGGIIDVFPPAHPKPLRLQLFGDQIEAMHAFDPVSQRLAGRQSELLLLPMREFDPTAGQQPEIARAIEMRALDLELARDERLLMMEGLASGLLFPGVEFCLPYFHEELGTLWEYLPAGCAVFVDQAGEVDAQLERAAALVERRASEREAEHRFFPPPEQLYLSVSAWRAALAALPVVEIESLDVLAADGRETRLSVQSFSTADLKAARVHQRHEVSFAPVAEQVRAWRAEGCRVVFVAGSEPQTQRLARLLEANEIPAAVTPRAFGEAVAGGAGPAPARRDAGVEIVLGHLSEGFRVPEEGLVVVTEADVFGEVRRRAARRVSVSQLLQNLAELRPEDYIVHLDHGVGIYRGLRHLQVAGTEGDYLHLEYAGGDRLYLPVDRISLVQKYVGAEGAVPALDRLGSGSWDKVKQKTRETIFAMAQALLATHAAREIDARAAYPPPDAYFREFEATFPFEETPDQQQAIDDVLSDMAGAKSMDRLVCGDVGYGKTEVAMRAALKAIVDGKQVAFLAPTTVLAFQHTRTLKERFAGFPVRIDMVSRFRTKQEQDGILKQLADGHLDIIVGTHRLLSKDVNFRDLGLLVVDEEQRFGVAHKERIKHLRKKVDVLTMTATPIPRTLNMSLVGIRDMSVIETPPRDRLSIQTQVVKFDTDVVNRAIRTELERDGQVYFVHNRVESIFSMASLIQKLVPHARIAIGHGQMGDQELERVMVDFVAKKYDVLVATTIVENGLDIPNANTIVINRADRYGLSQLYQLRGRVGRSDRRAYAYLLIPPEQSLSPIAKRRLAAIREFSDLGSGFRIAALDLEIRGAGNLLGGQQSGQIEAVGFDMYLKLLEETVRELKGEDLEDERRAVVNLRIDLRIDDTYIPDMNQRLMVYRRLARAALLDEVQSILEELRDRYGPLTTAVENLAQYARIRLLSDQIGLESLDREGTTVVLKFRPDARIDPAFLAELLQNRGDLKLLPPAVLRLDMARPEDAPGTARRATGRLKPARTAPDVVSSSWWTERATSEVAPGFTRGEILAEVPPDPTSPGGLFERLGRLLDQLSRALVTG